MPNPFASLPATLSNHLRLAQHVAVAQVAAYAQAVGGDGLLADCAFLDAYLDQLRPYLAPTGDLTELAAQAWEGLAAWGKMLPAQTQSWPLRRLAAAGLDGAHQLALLWAALVEEDARFGVLYDLLQATPGSRRLSVGLVDDLLRVACGPEVSGWAVVRDLHRYGLLEIDQPDQPRAMRPLRVPEWVWDACQGVCTLPPGPAASVQYVPATALPPGAAHRFPPNVQERLARLPALLAGGVAGGIILRGQRGSGRTHAAGAIARGLGCGLLRCTIEDVGQLETLARLAGPLAVLLGALPAFALELGPGEQVKLPTPAGYTGPLAVLLGPEGSVSGAAAESAVTLHLPPPTLSIRQLHWQRQLQDQAGELVNGHRLVAEQAAARFHLTLGGVEQAARLAQAYAALAGRDHVALDDVQSACRALNRQALEGLATPLEARGSWDQLIVSESVRADLESLVMRCRRREAVLAHLGPGFGPINRGVRALFSGPSGTGKTLAARLLAAELGLDLYRVDLASVVSKYIGETERNLSRLLARAEEQDVVLLLDEGDSLLTGRTEVRTANDRYANMETNYLLQRLEHYQGIFVVTTNAAGRIDSAFQRRMDVVVEFAQPTAAQRFTIWQLHLPAGHTVEEPLLRTVASRCALSGGQIRNAALHATVLAVDAGRAVAPDDVIEAVAREYRKLGAASPLAAASQLTTEARR